MSYTIRVKQLLEASLVYCVCSLDQYIESCKKRFKDDLEEYKIITSSFITTYNYPINTFYILLILKCNSNTLLKEDDLVFPDLESAKLYAEVSRPEDLDQIVETVSLREMLEAKEESR